MSDPCPNGDLLIFIGQEDIRLLFHLLGNLLNDILGRVESRITEFTFEAFARQNNTLLFLNIHINYTALGIHLIPDNFSKVCLVNNIAAGKLIYIILMIRTGNKRIDSFNGILIIQKRNCRLLIHLNLVICHCLQTHFTTDFTDILINLWNTDYMIQSEGNDIHSPADPIAVTLTLTLSNSLCPEAIGGHDIIFSKAIRIVIAKYRLI